MAHNLGEKDDWVVKRPRFPWTVSVAGSLWILFGVGILSAIELRGEARKRANAAS